MDEFSGEVQPPARHVVPSLHLRIDQISAGVEILRTTTNILCDPLVARCFRCTVEKVSKIMENRSVVVTACIGESDQVLVVGMEDDCCGIAVTGDNSRVILDGLSFS